MSDSTVTQPKPSSGDGHRAADPIGYLEDGVPYFAPLGELAYSPDEQEVQCHLCGGWFRMVAGPHLSRVHGWTAAEYREAFRLLSTQPTCSPDVSEQQRRHGIRRVASGETPVGARLDREAMRAVFAERRFPRWRSLAALHPELLAELHPNRNGDLDPYAIAAKSHRRLWWRCADGHEWLARVYNRTAGTGCPVCADARAAARRGQRTLADCGDELVAQLHPTLNGTLNPATIALRSHRKLWWHCPEGHVWRAAVASRTRGAGCPACRADGRA